MTVFTNHPILISEGMNPFEVSVGFKCEDCGKVTKKLNHVCFEVIKPALIEESFIKKVSNLFISLKDITRGGINENSYS